ncbi:UDP-N-acetylglucosamine 1-carboxyvinyltransferase 2 [Lentilactobacillus parabuchneri]|nr:UDP-N-acetylglucosamine 1-carboxyvinyltransferase 2 [Lentilactobacillus parabuchneri]
MSKLIIDGGKRLSGEISIGGAKNSTVALIPAAILADTPVRFDSVPDILDVHNLMLILKSMNVSSEFKGDVLTIDPTNIVEAPLPSKAIKSLRASYYFMGALLGRFQRATVSFPGGDNIGRRNGDHQNGAGRSSWGANLFRYRFGWCDHQHHSGVR